MFIDRTYVVQTGFVAWLACSAGMRVLEVHSTNKRMLDGVGYNAPRIPQNDMTVYVRMVATQARGVKARPR